MNKKVISKNHRILGDLFEYLLFQVNAEMTKGRFDRENYCARFGIRSSAAADARRIRIQLCKIAGKIGLDVNNFEVRKLGVLDAKKVDLLRKVVACGMVDKIARKNPEVVEVAGKKMRNTYISTKCDTLLIHPKSCLAALRPEFLCYQDLVVVKNKKYMVGVCGIEASWLPQWAAKRLYR